MASASKNLFIVAAKRTAFGTFGGKLKNITATELSAHASKAAIASVNLNPESIDSVIIGNVAQTSSDAAYLSRHAGLKAGMKIESNALTINRLCGSGFQSIINAAHEILLGESNLVLTGGTESMSQAPYAVRNIRFGTTFGVNPPFEDTLWAALSDNYIKLPMAITAENLAEQYGISRQDCDEFAYLSQQRWGKSNEAGAFKAEIAPIEVKGRKGMESFEVDEHPRPQTSLEKMAALKPVFKKDGTVTAGNASGICDGASAIIVAGEDAVKTHNLKPLARILGWEVAGVDPSIMGIGPVPAIRGLLQKTGLNMNGVDLVEVNEAFAAQFLAVRKELDLDMEKTNTNGGAIALGHPLGASGSRIMGHLTHELIRTNKKIAIGAACIGGGQGIAMAIENVN